ncbi:hypothetical protein TNCV_2761871 [Trichonephila clavipes]|nr:hypothetical protein TNCV_2761871 [Trichonephila clavipes]
MPRSHENVLPYLHCTKLWRKYHDNGVCLLAFKYFCGYNFPPSKLPPEKVPNGLIAPDPGVDGSLIFLRLIILFFFHHPCFRDGRTFGLPQHLENKLLCHIHHVSDPHCSSEVEKSVIVLLLMFHAEIVEVEIGGITIYHPFGEFRRAKSYCHLYGAQGQRSAYF